mgnify:FL=1
MKISDKITVLFTDRIWSLDTSGCSKAYASLVHLLKLVLITVNTFTQNKMGYQCIALSYFVMMALVPFVALLFALTGGLGLSDRISEVLYMIFPANPEFVSTMMEKANGLLDTAKGGGPGLISFLIFLWAIVWMMFQVETVFNNVWGIRKIPRKLYKRFGFYIIVLALSPLLVFVFSAGIAFYTNITNLFGLDLSNIRSITKMLGYLGFYTVSTLTFSAMFTYIPATKVKYRYGLQAAALTALVFVVFQYLYLETQMFIGKLSRAYGVIAAIPLFLIWLNYSWQIIIYGAELTYGFQNVDKYKVPEWDSENR